MSRSQNIDDALVPSKEHPDSSLSDDGCSSGSTASQRRVVLKKGPWTSAEDALLIQYVKEYGEGNWNAVQKESRLLRCGKSCRLRWANHLRPHLKKGTFSQEEEQLIIKMHFQMGNKWAQMAANLPGRTDNEIKNYWNTRVKRRQRAGLPLYTLLNTQASNEYQPVHNTSELSSGDQQNNGVLPLDMHAMPEFQFDSHEANPRPLSYAPTPLPNITITSIPIHIGSHTSCINSAGNHIKQAMISETSFPGLHFSFPNLNSDPIYLNPNPNPRNKNLASYSCSVPSNSGPSNYNFSSSRPFSGTVKMELPSLQFPETGFIDWNNPSSFTSSFDVDLHQSPIDVSAQCECVSSRNNGLLGDLIHESRAKIRRNIRSFEEFSSIAATHDDTDPKSPFCLFAVSIFNECNPITSRSYLDEFPSFGACSGSEETMPSAEQVPALHEPVKDALNIPDLLRPDALLGSDWFLGNIGDSSLDIAVPTLREEQVPASSGTSPAVSQRSHPWTSMPRAFQISEQ